MEGRLKLLKEWRRVTLKAAAAIKRLYPQAEIYLFGGAAEGRLTVLSDIDLAVVFDDEKTSGDGVLATIWKEPEKRRGLTILSPRDTHAL